MRISDWSSDVCSSDLKAARFFGSEAALYFANGFAANVALFASLPQRGDLILADELIHASAHDGLRMKRADHMFAPHNDVKDRKSTRRNSSHKCAYRMPYYAW